MAPLLNTLAKPALMLGAAAQNALEVARFGGLAIDEQPSPYTVHSEHRIFRLRRYHADSMAEDAPPVVLVPPPWELEGCTRLNWYYRQRKARKGTRS